MAVWKISEDVFYVGVNDTTLDLFESQYRIPDGVTYNSYVIKDSKIAVMDRIYTKELKNAFKRATDKGARGIMVVNTVNYYNRDNWTELPAMGYEEDEGTTSQVFSISGDDGVKLWNMINPDKKTEVKRNNKEDFKDKLEQYYPIDMASWFFPSAM